MRLCPLVSVGENIAVGGLLMRDESMLLITEIITSKKNSVDLPSYDLKSLEYILYMPGYLQVPRQSYQ